jgi:hypothetical protein
VMPAKLRVAGVDRTFRCEGRVDEGTVRLTAMLPFLRIDGGVDVVLGENGEVAEHGVIKKIAVDPSTSDGVPRLAVDVVLTDETQPYGANRHVAETIPPPTRLPPPCGHPLPSVLVSPGLVRDLRRVEERPPRRRVHGTAEIARRPELAWSAPPAVVSPPRAAARGRVRGAVQRRLTARVGALGSAVRRLRSGTRGVLLILVPVVVVAILLAI